MPTGKANNPQGINQYTKTGGGRTRIPKKVKTWGELADYERKLKYGKNPPKTWAELAKRDRAKAARKVKKS